MAKDSSFNLKTKKYEVFKSNEIFKKFGKVLLKLIKIFAKVISSAIILFVISKIVPEIREKMPTFFNVVDTILESFDNLLKNSALISKWF